LDPIDVNIRPYGVCVIRIPTTIAMTSAIKAIRGTPRKWREPIFKSVDDSGLETLALLVYHSTSADIIAPVPRVAMIPLRFPMLMRIPFSMPARLPIAIVAIQLSNRLQP
jgi:hypothetical protein